VPRTVGCSGDRLRRRNGHQPFVDHRAHVVMRQLFDLLNLGRGAEAVEEVHEGQAGFQAGGLGDKRRVHRFLRVVGGDHPPARRTGGHDIRVVAEDRQRLGGDSSCSDVEDRRRQFAGNLEHVGDHQQ